MVEEVEDLRGRAPDVLLDKLVIGISAEMSSTARLTDVARRLVLAGLGSLMGPAESHRAAMRIGREVSGLCHDGTARIEGLLRFWSNGETIRIHPSSHLAINGMRLMRTQLKEPAEPSFAADNLVGPYCSEWASYLEAQTQAIEQAVADVVAAVDEACGSPAVAEGRLRLRWVEVCRDLAVPDAPHRARRFAATWSGGEHRTEQEYYARTDAVGVLPTVSWRSTAKEAPWTKVYAKARDLIRTEIVARTAGSVGRLLTGRASPAEADVALEEGALVRALSAVAAAAVPLLDHARLAVEEVEDEAGSPVDLLLALQPLLSVAAPAQSPAPGRPISAASATAARGVLEALLLGGRTSATGLRSGGPVRRALDALTEGDAPVLRREGRRGTFYSLSSRWSQAARIIARVPQNP